MIIIKIMGGLGNQMQQYALFQKFIKLGREAKLDLSWFDGASQHHMLAPRELELSNFIGLELPAATPEDLRRVAGGTGILGKLRRRFCHRETIFWESDIYHPEIFQMDNVLLEGYWANNRYYEDILPWLRQLFIFPQSRNPGIDAHNRELIEEMDVHQEFSCAIHLRRGDYLDAANAALLSGICTSEYYEGAVNLVERRAAELAPGRPIHFYVFSDEPAYARTCRFGTQDEKITVCDWNQSSDSMLDMELMAHCDAVIAANSTFSFWGGRLNVNCDRHAEGKGPAPLLIRPLYHRTNQELDPEKMHGYWKGWILLDKDGKEV